MVVCIDFFSIPSRILHVAFDPRFFLTLLVCPPTPPYKLGPLASTIDSSRPSRGFPGVPVVDIRCVKPHTQPFHEGLPAEAGKIPSDGDRLPSASDAPVSPGGHEAQSAANDCLTMGIMSSDDEGIHHFSPFLCS